MQRSAYTNGQGSLVLAIREMGKTLFESTKYADRARDNHWYVHDLYQTYLMRGPDPGGWAFWEGLVPNLGREAIRRAFDESSEFINLVNTITPHGTATGAQSSLVTARTDPFNQPSNELTSRDAAWGVSLLSLPGRAGLDLGLGLSYSSMVWTSAGPYMYFDEDGGSPSPGFRLGFPTIQERLFNAKAGDSVYLLSTSQGHRVELRQVGSSTYYEAVDSSYLQLIDNGSSLLLRSMDGTQMTYGKFEDEWRCQQIKDRNGNFITVNYNALGNLTTVTDTLGRVITFNYDSNANIVSITQPWNGGSHTWATFAWGTHNMQSSFSPEVVVGAPNNISIPVLTSVSLHDSTSYHFEYTNALQASVIRRKAFGTVALSYTAFTYDNPATDCPRLTSSKLWAQNWTGINEVPTEVVTHYEVLGDGSHQLVAPDGTLYKEFYGSGWKRGLTTLSEVWSGAVLSNGTWSGGVKEKWTTTDWTQDNLAVSFQTNPRITFTKVSDSLTNGRPTQIAYTTFTIASGATVSLPSDVYELNSAATATLRRKHIDYRYDGIFLARHIIGLPAAIYVYQGDNALQAKRVYDYDWPQWPVYDYDHMQATPSAPTQHDQANFGSEMSSAGRGNLVSVQRWDANYPGDPSKVTESKIGYWTTGTVAFTRDASGHQTNISYNDSYSADGDNISNPAIATFAYPTKLTDPATVTANLPDGNSSSFRYHFDFGARTRSLGPAPTGQPQGLSEKLAYDAAGRVERITITNNQAYTRFVYGPTYVQSYSSVNAVADQSYAMQMFDGHGRLIIAASNHPGSSGGYSAALTVYDKMGRAVKVSNPVEVNSSWAPTGDDTGWLNTVQTYDWNGRPLRTTHPDGKYREASYGGCGCAGSSVVTLTDEGTMDGVTEKRRQQKIYSDVLGRTVKTEALNWQGGTPYTTIVNTYDALDEITRVRQWSGAEGAGTHQDTDFTYDGHGRLRTRHAPEQQTGTATTWDYNADDTVQKVTDARGASQTLSYNSRHLTTGITYAAPVGIPTSPNVSLAYDVAGNRLSMTDGLGSVSYQYNQLSQMTSEARTFSDVGNPINGVTKTLSYDYDLNGELKSISDPTGATINYAFDTAGRLNAVTGSSFGGVTTYASGTQYRAWGGLKHLNYGNTRTLNATYNSRLQPASFNIPGVMSKTYDYFADGQLRFSSDLLDHKFDRSYSHDHLGRLKQAFSGAEARGEPATNDRPYKQTFGYDGFSHLTNRNSNHWSDFHSLADSYTNNRRDGWDHDAEGNLLASPDATYTYDAAGAIRTVGTWEPQSTTTRSLDGEGRQVKTVESTYNDAAGIWVTTTTYYLRASVLGGQVLAELAVDGAKTRTFVYAGGAVLAQQKFYGPYQGVEWEHRDPSNATFRTTMINGALLHLSELDPTGADAGTHAPLITEPNEEGTSSLVPYPSFGASNQPGAIYTVDGIPVRLEYFMRVVDDTFHGSLVGMAQFFERQVRLQQGWIPGVGTQTSRVDIRVGDGELDIGTPRSHARERRTNNWNFAYAMLPQNTQMGRRHPGKPTAYVDEKVLNRCTQDYFGVSLDNFKPSVSGGIGEFTGTGPSYLSVNPNGAGNNDTFTIRNNATTYSNSYLKFKQNETLSALGLPPDHRPIVGLAPRSTPYVNYTGNDLKDPMEVLRTQIHELGHSLDRITQIGYDDSGKQPGKDDLGGRILEDCVTRRGGFRYK